MGAEGEEAMEGLRAAEDEAGVDSGANVGRERGRGRCGFGWSVPWGWGWSITYMDAAEDAEHLHESGKLLQRLHAPFSGSRGGGHGEEEYLVELQLDGRDDCWVDGLGWWLSGSGGVHEGVCNDTDSFAYLVE